MKNNILEGRPQLRRIIRFTEVFVIVVLLVFAIRTYRELAALRASPVILPSYWFNIATGSEPANRIQARGSWVTMDGSPEFLHTTSIDCIKAKLQCVESSAVVSVSEGGFLESVQTIFDVDSWTDTEIVTKSDNQPCTSRILTLDIANKQARSVVTPNAERKKTCKGSSAGEQKFKLVTGSAAHAAATGKNK